MGSSGLGAPPPQALILAAGVGRRLGEQVDGPKILLEFGGKSLLQRHVEILHEAGVSHITIVVGHAADALREAIAALPGPQPTTVFNEAYTEGSVVSLWTARQALCSGTPILLMDGDVLYDSRLMARLIETDRSDCLLLDRDIEAGDEPVKLCVRDGEIVDFRKRPTQVYDWHGESVGFFRFTPDAAAELARRADAYVQGGQRGQEYEEPIRDMIMQSPAGRFGFEDITGLPWTEIDFPADVIKARALLPALQS